MGIVTTEEVLTEVLAFFSERGQYLRELATAAVRSICANSTMMVLPQSHQTFITGLVLYEARPDKGYSLTDCISMEAMRREGITEILTHDGQISAGAYARLLHALYWPSFGKFSILNRGDDDGKRQQLAEQGKEEAQEGCGSEGGPSKGSPSGQEAVTAGTPQGAIANS